MSRTPNIEIRPTSECLIFNGPAHESAGAVLRGDLKILLPEALKVKIVSLRLEGKMKVCWDDVPGVKSNPKNETRTLVSNQWTFVEASKKPIVLGKGEHTYPFEIALSGNLPETVHTEYGTVKYKLRATIERPTFCTNYIVEKEVVIKRFALSSSTELIQSVSIAEVWNDKLAYDVHIPSKAFGPGENLPIRFNILLMSEDLSLRKVSCLLKEYITYRVAGGGRCKLQTRWITRLSTTDFTKTQSNWENQLTLEIPSPSEAVQCDCMTELIHVRHKLKVKIEFRLSPGVVKAVYVGIPVVIVSGSSQEIFLDLPPYRAIERRISLASLPPSYDTLFNAYAPTYEGILSHSLPPTPS
ncbi:hypothetical protein K493DRAFT_303629 [Basidiobolus meristosporus CBS 931.73]|uniref:Arrestin C-terminal-like domain-containing protein n=1 Tax=Basidiobolus meristosporus CBS 931.73 TaxID=1314790 RepID=A0A1Y1Y2E1_9FUNG|nr:hypothetical protein K493DRAFT_303629 [Basidiobolus meristosporus CBS 931.73]|eukprot:ORX92045.1 hypothetical protein K493DRAFT_303629 [Basidiobolus meristosporus CBS 931.73]